jgi:hypothetical protein
VEEAETPGHLAARWAASVDGIVSFRLVRAGPADRVAAWLASPAADPLPQARALREAFGRDPGLARAGPHGTVVLFVPGPGGPRRALEIDRHGRLLAALRWRDAGLAEAAVCIPGGSWLLVEPAVTAPSPWGVADRLWQAAGPGRDGGERPLTVFSAVSYDAVEAIPPLAEPGRVPPGGGTVVLNLIAQLAHDQHRTALPYGGPFPTEQLFLALLESFRFEPAEAPEPLRAFAEGRLAWRPAPHARAFEAHGVHVQLRAGVEKVVWEGRAYHRPRWQSVTRHAPRRVRDAEDGVRCSLWALGEVLEDHLHLAPDGTGVRILAPAACPGPARPLPAEVACGIADAVAAASAPALAPFVREAAAGLAAGWGPVDRDLVALDGDVLRVSSRLARAAAARLRRAAGPEERLALGLGVVAEVAGVAGDALRARAVAALERLPVGEQEAALARVEPPGAGDAVAARIAEAARAVAADLSAGGLDDEPDVEGDEGGHRERGQDHVA